MNGIRFGKLKIDAVEKVFFIALIVDGMQFRRVQKAAGVEPVHRKEVPPFLRTIGHPESAGYRAEAAVTGGEAPCRGLNPKTRTRSHLNHQTGLVAILGGRTSGNGLQRLNRIQRNLIRENLALLIGDWLPIN